MDDAENYAQGARQLPILLQDSSKGSLLTGIGFAWDKFSAYASDWDEYAATPEGAGFAADAAPVSGFDIWSGGTREFSLPRARADSEEVLLGKRGTYHDRHSLAAAEAIGKPPDWAWLATTAAAQSSGDTGQEAGSPLQ